MQSFFFVIIHEGAGFVNRGERVDCVGNAAEPMCVNTAEPSIQVYANGIAVPYSTYYRSGSLNMEVISGNMCVTAITRAYQAVNHIYHDVTIYKNGSWYSSERYENRGKVQLVTNINVPAQSGDRIEVYVDHYTEHNGLVESAHSSKTGQY